MSNSVPRAPLGNCREIGRIWVVFGHCLLFRLMKHGSFWVARAPSSKKIGFREYSMTKPFVIVTKGIVIKSWFFDMTGLCSIYIYIYYLFYFLFYDKNDIKKNIRGNIRKSIKGKGEIRAFICHCHHSPAQPG